MRRMPVNAVEETGTARILARLFDLPLEAEVNVPIDSEYGKALVISRRVSLIRVRKRAVRGTARGAGE